MTDEENGELNAVLAHCITTVRTVTCKLSICSNEEAEDLSQVEIVLLQHSW